MLRTTSFTFATTLVALAAFGAANAETAHGSSQGVGDEVVAEQRAMLAEATAGKGYGPQSPRDIDALMGQNPIDFANAPVSTEMNLCNIHFHENAEHKGGEFTQYAGNGDGEGNGTGFKYTGHLSEAELASTGEEYGVTPHGSLVPGDTIEVHYVYSTAQVTPGPTLNSCLSEAVRNPQLRVETQVYVLVNDENALDFTDLAAVGEVNGFQQALNIPHDTGTPVQYDGSTTGPGYNEKASPFQVTWSVRPRVAKVNISTVGTWLAGNVFEEDHAHGVRNLVVNPDLLSKIGD